MSKPARASLPDVFESMLNPDSMGSDAGSVLVEQAEPNTIVSKELRIDSPASSTDFDFGNVPGEAKAEINSLQNAIVVKLTSTIVAVGEDLLRLQKMVELHCVRGTWSKFLESGLPFSATSARNYMRAAQAKKVLEESGATVAEKMSPTALYEVRGASEKVLMEIKRRVDDGKVVSGQDVRDMRLALQQSEPADGIFASPMNVDMVDIPSGDTDRNAENRSLVLPKSTAATSSTETKSPEAAATELIARLREHYDDDIIIELDGLWHTAGHGSVRLLLFA